jgi:DNA-binding SARP family transcriptional activator
MPDTPHVRFQLLGRFEVHLGDRRVPVGGPTAQAVLIALLDRPGQRLLAQQVVAAVWGRPHEVTDDSLYHYIGKLRRALAPLGVRIESCWPGYRLVLPAQVTVDAARFAQLAGAAQAVRAEEPRQAAKLLRAALDLWQAGRALPGLALPGPRDVAARLEEQRLSAAERLAGWELADGHPDQVLARLRALAQEHPDRGPLTAAVMRALHAAGRTAEALTLYRRAEHAARRQGRQPAQVVLAAQRELLSGPAPAAAGHHPAGPYQLPADTSHFTGRAAELARLRALWPPGGTPPAELVVFAVDGMAGIGKTALAVHAAHELAGRFEDGNLFLDLRGFTPRARPIAPDKALDILLRGLGVAGQQIPPDLDARAALYRSRLARRRMLIVLDNALEEAQVRPLLPGTAGCLVLTTSRRRLSGLDNATHLTLDTLRPEEAADLFRAVASDRVAGDHHTVEEIVRTCGELPLAIRIAAARLRTSRAMSPTTLLSFLRRGREEPQLAGLDDGERSVAAAFDLSYRHLGPDQQQAFRLLVVHPGPTFDRYAAAAVLAGTLAGAEQELDALEQVNLILQPTPGRYQFHDLLRAYAGGPVSGAERRHALTRLLDHYAHTAAVAMDALYPYESGHRPRIDPPGTPTPPLAGDHTRAAAWLHGEAPNLLAAAALAAASHPTHVLHLSATLARYLRTRARYADGHALHTQALGIARDRGDAPGELAALIALGRVEQSSGDHPGATAHYRQALEIAGRIGDAFGQIAALNGLGHVARLTTADPVALAHYRRAVQIARLGAHPVGQIDAHWGLGKLHSRAGRRRQAARSYAYALRLARRTGHHGGQIRALTGIGHLHRRLGCHASAVAHFTEALRLAVEYGDLGGEVYAVCGLGDAAGQVGAHEEAAALYRRGLGRARDISDRNGRYEALLGLGRSLRAMGHPDLALRLHREALDIATALGQPHDLARAMDGLAHDHRDLGQPAEAAARWRQALEVLTRLGTPAPAVRTHLASMSEPPPPP